MLLQRMISERSEKIVYLLLCAVGLKSAAWHLFWLGLVCNKMLPCSMWLCRLTVGQAGLVKHAGLQLEMGS